MRGFNLSRRNYGAKLQEADYFKYLDLSLRPIIEPVHINVNFEAAKHQIKEIGELSSHSHNDKKLSQQESCVKLHLLTHVLLEAPFMLKNLLSTKLSN